MRVLSSSLEQLTLEFRIRFTGEVQNHAEASSSAASLWRVDNAALGTFAAPWDLFSSFEQVVVWTAPFTVSSGSTFTLLGSVEADASDYHGYADLRAELLNVTARDSHGAAVPVVVQMVPEPGTGVVLAFGLAAVLGMRRCSRRFADAAAPATCGRPRDVRPM